MVAGCELWRQTKKQKDDGLEWARRKMQATAEFLPSPLAPSKPDPEEEETSESVLKLRVDQSWNVRVLWEGRVKELLVSAGVGLGPGSFSPSLWSNPPPGSGSGSASGLQSGGGGLGGSYWRGVGVSVLYSS